VFANGKKASYRNDEGVKGLSKGKSIMVIVFLLALLRELLSHYQTPEYIKP
jgi:hypothetical protein